MYHILISPQCNLVTQSHIVIRYRYLFARVKVCNKIEKTQAGVGAGEVGVVVALTLTYLATAISMPLFSWVK